jgi:NMD protein affecting ribosome stability and mRNA decay
MRDDHEVVVDDKDQWWVTCPYYNSKIPEDAKPEYCPHCGAPIDTKEWKHDLWEGEQNG